MEGDKETVGSVLVDIRELLKELVHPKPDVEGLLVVPRPRATDWLYGTISLTTTEMSDIVVYKPGTGARVNPVCVIVRTVKASNIDVCLTPLDEKKSEIIAPGVTTDNGIFIHWFPSGIYTVGTTEGENKVWVRGQGIADVGKAEAVILFEETIE